MRPIKLEDIIPTQSEFTLRSTGRSYRVRPVSIEDRVWITSTYGDNIEAIFKQVRVKEIAHIAYHQLTDEDKKTLAKQKVTFIDDEGTEQHEEIGGVRLFIRLIQGNDEMTAILTALLHAIGISQPMIDEMADDAVGSPQKKSPTLTGEKSSTPWPANMDGPSPKSESSL